MAGCACCWASEEVNYYCTRKEHSHFPWLNFYANIKTGHFGVISKGLDGRVPVEKTDLNFHNKDQKEMSTIFIHFNI